MELKSLEEYNDETMQKHEEMRKLNEPHANGLACPKCGKELWDSNPCLVLTRYPAKKDVHCPECGFKGCRWFPGWVCPKYNILHRNPDFFQAVKESQ